MKNLILIGILAILVGGALGCDRVDPLVRNNNITDDNPLNLSVTSIDKDLSTDSYTVIGTSGDYAFELKVNSRNLDNIQTINSKNLINEFFNDFPDNFNTARLKYEGKEIILEGKIGTIISCADVIYLGEDIINAIIVEFPEDTLECIDNGGVKFNLDDFVTVKGRISFSEEYKWLVFLTDVVLLN